MAEILGNHRLADAGGTLEQYILATLDEVELEQTLDEGAVDFLGMAPVEAVERLECTEAGEPRATREIDGGAAALFEIGELLDDLGGSEATLVCVGQVGGQRVVTGAKAEPTHPLDEVIAACHRNAPGRAG